MRLTVGVDARHLLEFTPSGIGRSMRALLVACVQRAPSSMRFVLFANTATRDGSVDRLRVDVGADTERVRVVNPGIPNRLLNASLWALRRPYLDRLLATSGESIDVFWSPNVLFSSLSSRVPSVMTVHDLSFFLLPETYSRRRQWWHAAVRARSLFEQAAHICAVSEATKRDVQSVLAVPQERVTVIPHGPLMLADTAIRPSGLSSEVTDATPFVVSIGTREPRKNLVALVRAFESLVNEDDIPHHLVLAGGAGWKERSLQRVIRDSSVRDRVHLPGYVSEEEKRWLLDRAAVLAFPSVYEGFGLPPLEAFAAGVPVLASSTAAVAETVGEAGVLVHPYSQGELTFGLRTLLQDADLRAMCVARGRERLKAFSWDRSAERLLEVFEQVGRASSVE